MYICKRKLSILLTFVLLLLSACGGKEGIPYNSSHSEKMYPVITTTEPKPGDHLYAVTIVLSEKIQSYLEKYFKGKIENVGYAMPLHFPEHQQYRTERDNEYYWITIHDQNKKFVGYKVVSVNAKTGNIDGIIDGPCTVDWKSLAGYTSLEAPLYLYREGLNYYAIIDKKAYCLNPEIGSDIKATDDFLHFQNTTIEDISV